MKQMKREEKTTGTKTMAIDREQMHQVHSERLHRERTLKKRVTGRDVVATALEVFFNLPDEEREQHLLRWLSRPPEERED